MNYYSFLSKFLILAAILDYMVAILDFHVYGKIKSHQ